LLKEIALLWAKGKLCTSSQLVFLIQLHDSRIKELKLVADLVNHFYQMNDEQVETCAEHMFKDNGKSVMFLFDGYDELPELLKQDSLIAKIIEKKVLPLATVIISSRPHASVRLHHNASCHVDILGFTPDDQKDYIENSLNNDSRDIEKFTKFFDSNPNISTLCCVPSNLAMLVWLFKQGITLPTRTTELYNYFVCYAICRHLNDPDCYPIDIADLGSLPEPYKTTIQQISALCLRALDNNQTYFTAEELQSVCPNINDINGAINCFGVLNTESFHTGMGAPKSVSTFIHFSILEYLAAYQIACLPPEKEFKLLETKFLSEEYANTFTMYMGQTKGQRPAF